MAACRADLLRSVRRGRLVPGTTVHVVIDDQNDFLHDDGWYATHGVDIAHMQRVIEPTKVLNAECRKRGVPIIWTRHGTRGIADGGAVHGQARPAQRGRPAHGHVGLRDHRRARRAARRTGSSRRSRLSAFFQTNLEQLLRALGAETVLITGVLTNQCVGATCKDAMFRDFQPIVVEECVGTATPHLHDAGDRDDPASAGGRSTRSRQTLAELRAFPAAGE